MGFFRKLFGQQSSQGTTGIATPLTATPGQPIRYDARLVDDLLDHHAQLGKMYSQIGRDLDSGRYEAVRTGLQQFKRSVQAHVLTENVRFYTYLENMLQADQQDTRTMRDFRREMNGITRQVMDFVSRWQDSHFASAEQRSRFHQEYQNVAQLLEQRFDNEENSLYPLYGPA